MIKKIKIDFRELSKQVTAEVQLSYEGEDSELPSNEEIQQEARNEMLEAMKFSSNETLKKIRGSRWL